jgi:hypothetical protein
LGRLVHFPRTSALRGESEWHDPAENALRSTRKSIDVSLVMAIDAKRSRETEEDFDGGGGSAA